MRQVKRWVMALMCAALMSAVLLCGCALAAPSVQPSDQPVTLNGEAVYPAGYNIDGSNYYKLRDLASLLSGTAAGFQVGYSAGDRTMTALTGQPYTAVGGELSRGEDQSASCVKSDWTLSVDGTPVTCQIYNIGGNNYFKLRDLGAALGFGVDYDTAKRTVLLEVDPVPAADFTPDFTFSVQDLNGKDWTEQSFAEHKLTMVNFWAYWCGPCIREMPDLQRLYEDVEGLSILGVIVDDSDMDATREAVADAGVGYPVLYYDSAFEAYQTGYIPTTIFVDGSGQVLGEAYVGSRSYEEWKEIIDGFLK